jgi:pyrroline-5-carboxylate reductase
MVARVEPAMPLMSVFFIVLIVGAIVADKKAAIAQSAVGLLVSVFLLHAGGFALGWGAARLLGRPHSVARTIAIEVGMQNGGMAAALARRLDGQLVLSIAAGVRVADLSRWLGGHARIVRAMPNTPALVQAGIAGLYAPPAVNQDSRSQAEAVLRAVGGVVWVDDEQGLDAVTAVSGSGPAYVFYFIESLEAAGEALGLNAATARQLALQTFFGAAKLALESGEEPAVLRQRVTSKGGTTERGLATMEAESVKAAIGKAVEAAARRSAELGDELGRLA